jgi:hypothetical protein
MKSIITSGSLLLLFTLLPAGFCRAAIVANFNDGDGTTLVDQYTGVAGDGWLGPWSTAVGGSGTASAPAVLSTTPLNGGGNYLSVPFTAGSSINDNFVATIRQFGASGGVDPTLPHTIKFDYRPEAKNEIVNAEFRSRYQIFGSATLPTGDTSVNTTWWAVAGAGTTGSAPTGVVINTWGFLNNPTPGTTVAPTGMAFVSTGITMNANAVYHFEIAVNPAAKTYIGKISDGTTTFTSEPLNFRNQGDLATSASYMAFGARQQNTANEGLTDYPFSFDSVSIVPTPVTPPPHPGDFDSDGDVDGADFVAWQTNFPKASGATLAEGDADADADVDGADFVVWQTNFPFTPTPGTAPVPEPSAFLLATFAAIASFATRRKIH